MLNKSFYVLFVSLFLFSCKKSSNDFAKILADTDRYYSNLSAEKGRNVAFLALFDSSGVMLASHKSPIEGITAIREALLKHNDSTFILTWEPTFAKVSASNDLGYTYGIYKLTDRKSKKLLGEGTYTTFWHKNEKGEWKGLLDTGNEGLK